MATTTAELMITPEVSKKDLERSMKQIDKGIKKVAKNAEEELKDATEKGLKDGAQSGGGMAFVKKLGLAAVAAAVGAAVAQGFAIAAERVGSGEGLIGDILGDKSAQGAISFAKGQGMSQAQFQGLSGNVNRAGGDDQMTRDFVVDTSEYIKQAAAGENPLLANFQGLQGTEQFNAVLASMADMDSDTRNKFLADIGWAGDAGVINQMIDNLGGKTGKDAFNALNKVSATDKRRAASVTKEAGLERQFEDIQRTNNIAIKEDQLAAMSPAVLMAMGKAQRARAKDELKDLLGYEENLKAAEAARQAQQVLDDAMLLMATTVVDWFGMWGNDKDSEIKRSEKAAAVGTTVGNSNQSGGSNAATKTGVTIMHGPNKG